MHVCIHVSSVGEGGHLSHAPFLPKGGVRASLFASLPGYNPLRGRLGRVSFISILGTDVSVFHCSLDGMSFHLSGQQALVEIPNLLWEV